MTLKVLIVDDERLARKKLSMLIEKIENVTIVGEADCVDDAMDKIEKLSPDLLLLDIQMPGKSVFEMLNNINFKGRVIFVTAYDQYAIRAFELNALDYLLKPVTLERLKTAIDRSYNYKIGDPLQTNCASPKSLLSDDYIMLNFNNEIMFVKVKTIKCISAATDYTLVFLESGKKGLVLKSLNEWENRLPKNQFIRIHRSTIINIDFVQKVTKWFNYSCHVYIRNIDDPFILSRRYLKKLKTLMG